MSHKLFVHAKGKNLDGYAQIINGKLWIHREGQTFCIDNTKGFRKRRSKDSKTSDSQIISPMPGKITKIFVQQDDQIHIGQPIIVMEAMKMEYTLKSEIATKIEKINVCVGDQVQLGQLLVKLKDILKVTE